MSPVLRCCWLKFPVFPWNVYFILSSILLCYLLKGRMKIQDQLKPGVPISPQQWLYDAIGCCVTCQHWWKTVFWRECKDLHWLKSSGLSAAASTFPRCGVVDSPYPGYPRMLQYWKWRKPGGEDPVHVTTENLPGTEKQAPNTAVIIGP